MSLSRIHAGEALRSKQQQALKGWGTSELDTGASSATGWTEGILGRRGQK